MNLEDEGKFTFCIVLPVYAQPLNNDTCLPFVVTFGLSYREEAIASEAECVHARQRGS